MSTLSRARRVPAVQVLYVATTDKVMGVNRAVCSSSARCLHIPAWGLPKTQSCSRSVKRMPRSAGWLWATDVPLNYWSIVLLICIFNNDRSVQSSTSLLSASRSFPVSSSLEVKLPAFLPNDTRLYTSALMFRRGRFSLGEARKTYRL